jgi:hypothetical protein
VPLVTLRPPQALALVVLGIPAGDPPAATAEAAPLIHQVQVPADRVIIRAEGALIHQALRILAGYSGGGGGARSGGSSAGNSGNEGARSTGSAGPNNSGVHSGSAHQTPTPGSPQSNLRTGNASSERWSGNSGSNVSNSGPVFSRPTSQVVPIQQQQWMLEAIRLRTGNADVKSALQQGKINPELKGFGIAANRAAYREEVSKFGGIDISRKQPGWFAKHLLGKQEKQQVASSPMPRPCPGEECKPVLPPKPCVGKNCKPAPPPVKPPSPPVSGICLSGVPTPTGGCAPWGYLDHCQRRGNCFLQLVAVDLSYCERIMARIRQEERSTSALEIQRQAVCSSDPQGPACASINQDLQQTNTRIEQLRRQYHMCRMSTAWQPVRYP